MPNLPITRGRFRIVRCDFLKDHTQQHVYRVLIDHDARIVEALAGNTIEYAKGVHTFTVHFKWMRDGRMYCLYANKHGWAFTDIELLKLVRQRILVPVYQ